MDRLESIEKNGLVIKALAMDMHVQIRSYMKKCRSDIKHQFDVWHVNKSIKKSWEKFQKSVTVLA